MKENLPEIHLNVPAIVNQNAKTDLPLMDQKMLYNIFMQVPAILAVLKGPEFIVELANEPFEKIVGKENIAGQRIIDVLPRLDELGFISIFKQVYNTGEPYTEIEKKVISYNQDCERKEYYFDVNYQVYYQKEEKDKCIFLFVYDVTEKVLSRRRVHYAEKKFTEIFYKIPSPMYTCHKDGTINLYNEAFVAFFGRKPNQNDRWCLAKRIYTSKGELIPEAKWPFNSLFEKQYYGNKELILELENGERKSVMTYQEEIDGDEEGLYPKLTINSIVDITEQVKARQELEKMAKIIKNLYTNAPAFIGATRGDDFIVTLVNPELQKLFGNRKLENKKLEDAIPELKNQGVIKTLKSVYYKGKPVIGTEQLLLISPGENQKVKPHYISYSCQPMYNSGNEISGIIIFGYEVTKIVLERKKGAENIKKIMETLPQITSISSSRGTNIYFNKYFYKYSGLSKKEASVTGWNSILDPQKRDSIIEEWEECRREQKSFYKELLLRRSSDGMFRWHIAQLKPVKNALGEVINWVASAIDIHEQKVKEEKKDEFISIASHELKTPLTSVKAYLQLMESSIAEEEVKLKDYANKAVGSVNRLNDLISELLDVSKIQQDKFTLNATKCNFDELLRSAIESAQYQTKHKIKLFGDTIGEIQADKERIMQVLDNLISNANKYSPDEKEIHIIVERKQDELQVCVKDFGIGISPAYTERIFERYFRVSDNNIHFQGLGIGLYISMQIIQKHQGNMWVVSELGEGSSFYFSLPLNI